MKKTIKAIAILAVLAFISSCRVTIDHCDNSTFLCKEVCIFKDGSHSDTVRYREKRPPKDTVYESIGDATFKKWRD